MTKHTNIVGSGFAGFLACKIGGMRVAFDAPNDLGAHVMQRLTANHTETKSLLTRAGERIGAAESTLSEISTRLESLDRRVEETEQKSVRRPGGGGSPGNSFAGGPSLGQEFAQSQEVSAFRDAGYRGVQRLQTKTVITSAGGSAGGAMGGFVAPDRLGAETIARRPLTVRQLCRAGVTTSNAVTLMRQVTRANGAAVAPEGTLKSESGLAWAEVVYKVATIATWIPASRQVLDDAVGLQALVDSELRYMLQEKEEEQLLFGNGTGDNLMGVVPQAQAFQAPFAVANATPFDRLLQALAQASIANYRPSAIVLNVSDAFMLQSIKDTQGRYIGAGPYGGLANLLFSIPWVGTNAMPKNKFVLGDFANACQIFDRMNAEVLISTEDRDNFVKNMVTLLAEQRLAFVTRAPAAFVTGDLVAPAA